MSEKTLTLDDALIDAQRRESARVMMVVQHAADRAYRARVQKAIVHCLGVVGPEGLLASSRAQGISEDRWSWLRRSTRNAESPAEFQAFARALHVSARWLAIGAGWMKEPPAGWFATGTHIDQPGVALEFSVELDSDLLPLWERPVPAGAETRTPLPAVTLAEMAGARG